MIQNPPRLSRQNHPKNASSAFSDAALSGRFFIDFAISADTNKYFDQNAKLWYNRVIKFSD
jgi:hypothetical protein